MLKWSEFLKNWVLNGVRLHIEDGNMYATVEPNVRLTILDALVLFKPLTSSSGLIGQPPTRIEYNDLAGTINVDTKGRTDSLHIFHLASIPYNRVPLDVFKTHEHLEVLRSLGYEAVKDPDDGWVLQGMKLEVRNEIGILTEVKNLNIRGNIQLPMRIPLIIPDEVEEIRYSVGICQVKYKGRPYWYDEFEHSRGLRPYKPTRNSP